jgi:hypothetical protein
MRRITMTIDTGLVNEVAVAKVMRDTLQELASSDAGWYWAKHKGTITLAGDGPASVRITIADK